MVLLRSWSDDIMHVIKPGEWVSEPEIHRRVVRHRIETRGYGPLSWFMQLVSPKTAEAWYFFTTADRTLWSLSMLVYTKDMHVRQMSEPTISNITVMEAPLFEYCLGAGATMSRTTKSTAQSSDPLANMACA